MATDRPYLRPFLARAWELRATVRGWEAMYVALAVALAAALDAALLTTDRRLAGATGPRCRIEVIAGDDLSDRS